MTRKNPGKLVPNELVDAPWEEVKNTHLGRRRLEREATKRGAGG